MLSTHLFEERATPLLSLLVLLGQLLLQLRLECLHVDFQSQLGVFGSLQLVLQLLDLQPLLLRLVLQLPLRLLQIMNLKRNKFVNP